MLMAEYAKDKVIFHTGDYNKEFGILIFGKIHIKNVDFGKKHSLDDEKTLDFKIERHLKT